MSRLIRLEDAASVPTRKLGWPGMRFRMVEAAGEPMDIVFKRYRPDGTSTDEVWFKHESHDGVGAFTAILEDRGLVIPTMPRARDDKPGFLKRLGILRRYGRRVSGAFPLRWKRAPDWSTAGQWPAGAVAMISREANAAFEASTRGAGSSPLAALTATLDRHVGSRFLQPGSTRGWFVPVNVRQGERFYGNTAVGLVLPLDGEKTPAQVHALLKEFLSSGFHWAPTAVAAMVRHLPLGLLQRAARFRPDRTIFGFVTTLGAWPPPDATIPEDDDDGSSWAVVPPVTRRAPFSCTLIDYRGTLSLGMAAHGCLGLSADEVRGILETALGELGVPASIFTDHGTASDVRRA